MHAVRSVLNQAFAADDFEVIVVNDSGKPLPPADWEQSPRVRVITTQRRKLCFARNTGAVIARGQYLHFLDDDDWLLPDALQTFWDLAQSSKAAWLHGTCKFVNEDGQVLTNVNLGESGNVFARLMSPGQWMPIQSVMIQAKAFFEIGGFEPQLLGAEDIHLCRRIALRYSLATTPIQVACMLRGKGWNTTFDYSNSVKYYRIGREMNLNEPGVFSRLHASVTSGFWHGRIVRIYLASMAWNLTHEQIFAAASRATSGAGSFILAGTRVLSRDFWRGIVAQPTHNTDW